MDIKNKMFNVQVENTIESIKDLKNIKIVGSGTKSIPISDIASISLNNGCVRFECRFLGKFKGNPDL